MAEKSPHTPNPSWRRAERTPLLMHGPLSLRRGAVPGGAHCSLLKPPIVPARGGDWVLLAEGWKDGGRTLGPLPWALSQGKEEARDGTRWHGCVPGAAILEPCDSLLSGVEVNIQGPRNQLQRHEQSTWEVTLTLSSRLVS